MMGINVNRTISVTFLLAGALAGAPASSTCSQFNMRYDTGFELGLIAFTAAVLGGIGNLAGAVLGALVIGFIQASTRASRWLAPGSDWTRSIVFGILIADPRLPARRASSASRHRRARERDRRPRARLAPRTTANALARPGA